MTILNETSTLSNDVTIPKLGLDTWFIDDDKAADAIHAGIEVGYRTIDAAQAHGNERGVGEAVRTVSVPRQDLFVSTKLAAEIRDHDAAAAAIDRSRQTTGLDDVDLMLTHAPQPRRRLPRGRLRRGVRRERAAAVHPLYDPAGPGVAAVVGEPVHMRSNADVVFEISESDMHVLRDLHAQDHAESIAFPVYNGK